MNGIIILDKPQDFTSFDVIAVMRKISGERKIGHTGTLDPMATGVLPLLFGRAAKAADLLPDTDKIYHAKFKIGIKTDTGDITGKITQENSEKKIDKADIENAIPLFRGEIEQIPPMYSAVSVGGKRLYELARKGIEIEREARKVYISTLELISYNSETKIGELLVSCSKGTYIRTLIEDIAEKLGTCATMTALRRTKACGFSAEQAITLEQARGLAEKGELESKLLQTDSLFEHLRMVSVSDAQANRFKNGGELALERLKITGSSLLEEEKIRVYGSNGFIGLGQVDLQKKQLKILKLFNI